MSTAMTLGTELPAISVTTDIIPASSQSPNTGHRPEGVPRPLASGWLQVPSQHSEVAAFVLESPTAPSVILAHGPIDATKLEIPGKDNDGDENIADFFAEDNEVELYYSLYPRDLRRSASQRSLLSTRTTHSTATVVSHGVLRLLIHNVCDLIRARCSLHKAEVVSTECYYRRKGAIRHRFLILELRRAGKKDLWLRIDRRRDRDYPRLRWLTTLSTPANDLARMASRRETLLRDNEVLENRQLFERNPKLPQLEILLRVMMEELPTYDLLSANCWFYVSFLQEYLGENGNRGYFTKHGAIYAELAIGLRDRIRQAVLRYEHVESVHNHQTSRPSLSRVRSLETVSSAQSFRTARDPPEARVQGRSRSGTESSQFSVLEAERISPSTSARQIFDQFHALNRDIHRFCDDVAEHIGPSYCLSPNRILSTFHEGKPVWKAMREFQSSEDYIFFNLRSIMSALLYHQIFHPFHPASTDEENRSQDLEYHRHLKNDSAVDAGTWRCIRFRAIDGTISEARVAELIQRINLSIQRHLQRTLQLGGEKVLLESFTTRLDGILKAAYSWNRTAKREAEKYACSAFLVEPGTMWDPSRMESFERLRVVVSRDSKIISPVSLGLMASVARSDEYVPYVQVKAKVLVEEWFRKPTAKRSLTQSPDLDSAAPHPIGNADQVPPTAASPRRGFFRRKNNA